MSALVRLARSEDIESVRAIGVATWPSTYGPIRGRRFVREGLAEYWRTAVIQRAVNDGTVYVAESEGAVIGMTEVANLGDDLVMWKLYVLPSAQGRGIGAELVRAVKSRAIAAARDVLTEHDSKNSRAAAFYEREGFTATESPWPGTDAVWLRWRRAR